MYPMEHAYNDFLAQEVFFMARFVSFSFWVEINHINK